MLYQVMGNCVRTSLSGEENNDGGMIKVIAGRGGINYMGGGLKKYLCCREEGLISKLDVREGMDLQLGSNVAPCRLSSGTAADLLSKIGSNSYMPASMQRCRPTSSFSPERHLEGEISYNCRAAHRDSVPAVQHGGVDRENEIDSSSQMQRSLAAKASEDGKEERSTAYEGCEDGKEAALVGDAMPMEVCGNGALSQFLLMETLFHCHTNGRTLSNRNGFRRRQDEERRGLIWT
eukprot:Gb_36293 [translate_table: standard]